MSVHALPARPLRDAEYIRVSAVMGRDDERFLSPDLQRAAIRAARERAGDSVLVATEVDLDVSGGTMTRPGLSKLLELARAGGIDRLWVLDLSRWARVADEGLAELKRLAALGVEVMSTAERVDLGTPEGYFTATTMLAVHELRRRQIGSGWVRVHTYRAERGLWHGNPPTGYRRREAGDGSTTRTGRGRTRGELVVDERDGPLVTELFRRYATGEGTSSLRRWWHAERGVAWSASDVKKVLRSEVYLGRVHYAGRWYDGQHEPLVDTDLFAQVQARLEREAGVAPRARAGTYSLSGLVVCAGCGGSLHVQRAGGVARLYCRQFLSFKTCPGPGTPRVEAVEAAVLERVADWARQLRVDEAAWERASSRRVRAIDGRARWRRELEEARDGLGNLAVLLATGKVGQDAHDRAVVELEQRIADLQQRIAAAGPTAAAQTLPGLVSAAEELLALWPGMLPAERNAALRAVVERVVVRRGEHRGEPEAGRVEVVLLA